MRKKYCTALCIVISASLLLSGCGEQLAEEETQETADFTDEELEETADLDETSSEESTESETLESEISDSGTESSEDELITPVEMIDAEDQFTERDLDWSYDERDPQYITLQSENTDVSGISGVSFSDGVLTVTEEGVYVLSGSLSGQVLVNCEETSAKVQIVLSDAEITNDDGPCILAYGADKLFITLEGENILSNGGVEYVQSGLSDKTEDGAIFADCDLTLNGSGFLTINAGYDNAIVCKKDLAVTGGMYEIAAEGKGLEANDSIRIAAGVFVISSEDDCIHTDEDAEEGKGYVYIEDGTFTLKTGDDGIHAATALLIAGGTITITESYEGLEGDSVDILGGTIDIASSDDGINASTGSGQSGERSPVQNEERSSESGNEGENGPNGEKKMDGNGMEPNGEEMENAEGRAEILEEEGPDLEEGFSYEGDGENGMEPEDLGNETGKDEDGPGDIPDDAEDEDHSSAPDDLDAEMTADPGSNDRKPESEEEVFSPGGEESGDPEDSEEDSDIVKDENAPGESKTGHGGGMGGSGGMEFSSQAAYIRISGGTVHINAGGDGLDSNGDLYIEGGEIVIDGPVSAGDGSIDYGDGDAEGIITGGTLIALGSSGMAENFLESSTQYVVMISLNEEVEAGSEVILEDSEGNVIISYVSEKAFDNVIISTPELTEGTYILTTGIDTTEMEITDIVTEIGNSLFGTGNERHR